MIWLVSMYLVSIVGSALWFWNLHTKGELIKDYPYDDEM